jgi:hypothetical protein
MPKVRLLVPIDQYKTDDVLEVDDETANAWRSAGKAADYAAERAQTKQAAAGGGHYTDVVGRGDVAPLTPGASPPGPQADADEDDDSAKSKKGKK